MKEQTMSRRTRRNYMPMTGKDLLLHDAGRDIGAELLESVRQMQRDEGRVVYAPAKAAREKTRLSQTQFSVLLGVSMRTLQGWEQGRIQPSGAARTLLAIALRNPKALLDVAA
jgi:putative transcriptional regulator